MSNRESPDQVQERFSESSAEKLKREKYVASAGRAVCGSPATPLWVPIICAC